MPMWSRVGALYRMPVNEVATIHKTYQGLARDDLVCLGERHQPTHARLE